MSAGRRMGEIIDLTTETDRGSTFVLGRSQDKEKMRGGSSNVFKNALKAAVVKHMTVNNEDFVLPIGGGRTWSIKVRISSTELFEASSSWIQKNAAH